MNTRQKIEAALEALSQGDCNQAWVLASQVTSQYMFDRRITIQQLSDAYQIKIWAMQMRFAQG